MSQAATSNSQLSECAVIRLVPGDDKLLQLELRLKQQSELISLLKQRADNTLSKLQLCQHSYDELQLEKDRLSEELAEEKSKRKLLEQRFTTLSNNHEEIIRYKDEYKTVNAQLRASLKELNDEKSQVMETAAKMSERKLAQLEEMVKKQREENDALLHQCKLQEASITGLKASLAKQAATSDDSILALKSEKEKLRAVVKELQTELTEQKVAIGRWQANCSSLEQQCTQNSRVIKEHEQEIQKLNQDLLAKDTELHNLRAHFSDQEEMVSRDVCVQTLRRKIATINNELQSLQREYTAYKTHTTEQLKQERELNMRLRHLTE